MSRQRSLGSGTAPVHLQRAVLLAAGALATVAMTPADESAPPAAAVHAAVSVAAPGAAAYSQPLPGLTADQRALFERGKEEFEQRWVVPFHIGGHWGRGPLSNGETCTDCHAAGGRGRAPEGPAAALQSMLVRLSVPGADGFGGPLPHPAYGLQLQETGVLGKVAHEGRARVWYTESTVELAGGEQVVLRAPRIEVRDLNYGPLGENTLISARIAPAVFGLGLLEAVSEETLVEVAARQRALGYNGRLNRVVDIERRRAVAGRFGHKANQPSLRQQAATALIEDIGVTTPVFAQENCTPVQKACSLSPSGGSPELSDARLEALTFYLQALAAPARRNGDEPLAAQGEKLFEEARCSVCHLPALRTGDYPPLPQLSNRDIHAYTDLLLHDLGEGLADGRPDYRAGPRDWRTPPLWGIGLGARVNGNEAYLHDGRARTLTEAILWHGGEAQPSRDLFVAMRRQDRDALLAFLRSL
jgi:CxxC motif-containing protein (DUF1111 family)